MSKLRDARVAEIEDRDGAFGKAGLVLSVEITKAEENMKSFYQLVGDDGYSRFSSHIAYYKTKEEAESDIKPSQKSGWKNVRVLEQRFS